MKTEIIKTSKMIIEVKKLSDLIPAPYNPRQSTKKQEEHLKRSLEKFGVVEPVIVNKQTGHIVGGHFRVRELKKLGYKEVECVIVDLNEKDERELNIRLNSNTGQYDMEMIANEWDPLDLKEFGFDLPVGQDFSDKNKEIDTSLFDSNMTIKLEYIESDFFLVKEALSKIAPTPEQAVYALLKL